MNPFLRIWNHKQRWSQPAEELKEERCLRVESAPWQENCVQGELRREWNVEEISQRAVCMRLDQGDAQICVSS